MTNPEHMIQTARAGTEACLGPLLELYRNYLRLLARLEAAAFDAKHLQRFHNEAQAAAQLHHTNIVPVYAVGSKRGVHFYAMQLIEGQSLAAIIHHLRQPLGASTLPRERLKDQLTTSYPPSVEPLEAPAGADTVAPLSRTLSTQRSQKEQTFFHAAARFILQAAEALEHAHQFGIVHRDIKPANLLVDANGRLWITDFGLAQFHADAGLKQTGDIVGTLRYMSPEQASGQRVLLDHRCSRGWDRNLTIPALDPSIPNTWRRFNATPSNQVKALFTLEQNQRWQELTGEPFAGVQS